MFHVQKKMFGFCSMYDKMVLDPSLLPNYFFFREEYQQLGICLYCLQIQLRQVQEVQVLELLSRLHWPILCPTTQVPMELSIHHIILICYPKALKIHPQVNGSLRRWRPLQQPLRPPQGHQTCITRWIRMPCQGQCTTHIR